jgi:hypothetical protein
MGTTVRVASMRDDGQTFHESRTPTKGEQSYEEGLSSVPSRSSTSSKFNIVLWWF